MCRKERDRERERKKICGREEVSFFNLEFYE